jgi:hypothetical protein
MNVIRIPPRLPVAASRFPPLSVAFPVPGPWSLVPSFLFPFRNPKSEIRNAFPGPLSPVPVPAVPAVIPGSRLPLPGSRRSSCHSAIRNPQSAIRNAFPASRRCLSPCRSPVPGPRKRGRLRLPAKRAQRAGRLNAARRRLSPSCSRVSAVLAVSVLVPGPRSPFPPFFLPFRNPKSAIRNAFPGSRRSRRERKSHFCRNTYVNGRAQKQRVF